MKDMMNKQTITLADVGRKAIELHHAEAGRRKAVDTLREAYAAYSQKKGWGFIEKTSPEWAEIEANTGAEYQAFKRAKQVEYNAKRRLQTACKRVGALA